MASPGGASEQAVRKGCEALLSDNVAEMWRAPLTRPEQKMMFRSPFAAAWIATALDGCSAAVTNREIDYLLQTMEPRGVWRFAPAAFPDLPPDTDDSACALAALRLHDCAKVDYQSSLAALQKFARADGLFPTWLVEADTSRLPDQKNDFDVVVNLNVLYFAGLLDRRLPGVASAIIDSISRRGLACGESLYYRSPYVLAYFLGRSLDAFDERDQVQAMVRSDVEDLGSRASNSFDAALAANALLDLHAKRSSVEPLVESILDAQTADGRWPDATMFADPAGGIYGSERVTTTVAVQALSRFTARGW